MPPLPQFRGGSSVAFGPPPNPKIQPNMVVADALKEVAGVVRGIEETERKWQRTARLNDSQIGAAQDFEQLDVDLEGVPFDKKREVFEKRSADIRTKWLAPLQNDREAFEAYRPEFERMHGTKRIYVDRDARKGLVDHSLAQADTAADTFARQAAFARSPDERRMALEQVTDVYGRLASAGMITEGEGRARIEKVLNKADIVAAKQLIDANPWEARKALSDPKRFGALDPLQVEQLKDEARSEGDRRESKAREAEAAASANLTSGLMVKINQFNNGQGDFDQADLETARERMKPSQFAQVQMAYDDARANRTRADADRVDLAERLSSGGHIDPRDERQAKAYDELFRQSLLPGIQADVAALPPEQQASAIDARILSLVKDQGVVPKSMTSMIRGAIRGGSPDDRASAARTIDQIKTVAPNALNDFDDDTLRQANIIGSYIDGGMNATEAVRRADEALRRPPGADKALSDAYDDEVKTNPTSDWLSSSMDESWWGSPTVPVVVAAEVSSLVRNEFQRNGGNLEAARRTALDLTKRRYGPSSVNGETVITRNPIEQHYGAQWLTREENAKAIRDEAVSDLSTGGATDGPLTPDRVRILPYPAKGVVAPDGRPSYAIEVQDSSGAWTVQMDENEKSPTYGLPKPWWPSLSKVKADRDAIVKQAIEGAKISRRPMTGPIMPAAGVQ